MSQVNVCKKKQLLQLLSQVSFAMEDVALFLDTHPEEESALRFFQEYKNLRKDIIKEYADTYGPLRMADECASNQWLWATQPWPWKGEC